MLRTILLLWTIQACDRPGPPARASADASGGARTSAGEEREPPLDEGLLGQPAVAGDRVVWARREGKGSALYALEPGSTPRRLLAEGTPDRPALSPDGERVVFTWSRTGIASLWTMPFAGGEPTQLTNLGLERAPRTPGQPPAGFVPPPHRGPPEVGADGLVRWEGPDGLHELRLP